MASKGSDGKEGPQRTERDEKALWRSEKSEKDEKRPKIGVKDMRPQGLLSAKMASNALKRGNGLDPCNPRACLKRA